VPGLAEIVMTAAILSGQAGASGPVQLSVRQDGGLTIVRVVGSATAPFAARYALEVKDRAGKNRSEQRGVAHLLPGPEITLTTVRLSSDISDVIAKLTVEPDAARKYEQTFDVAR
jgi:hypothetical protein